MWVQENLLHVVGWAFVDRYAGFGGCDIRRDVDPPWPAYLSDIPVHLELAIDGLLLDIRQYKRQTADIRAGIGGVG